MDDLARGRSKVVRWWRARLPGLVLWELWATSRRMEGPLCAADGAWSGLEEGEGDGDGQAHKDCLHLPPSPIDPHGSTVTEESPGCGAGGREVGKSSMYSWVTSSRSEPQGEAKITFNGNYPVTSAWVICQFLFSLTSRFLFPLLLLTVSWSASHFCFVGCSYRVRPVWFYCWSFKEACQKREYLKAHTQFTHSCNIRE